MWEEAYKKKSSWGYSCRTLWMLYFPVGISVHGSFFPPGRSRGQIDSYSAHPLPFLFLLCATSGSAISMQLHYQHPPPYRLIAATSGTTQFHSFVSFPLGLVMSGPRAIGRDSPGKNIIWCQTLFFLAWLCETGERTMYLFSPHPQTSSAFPFSSSPGWSTYSLPPHPIGTWHIALPTFQSQRKEAELWNRLGSPTSHCWVGMNSVHSFQKGEVYVYLTFPSLFTPPKKLIIFFKLLFWHILVAISWFPFLRNFTLCPDAGFLTLHNTIARAHWNLFKHGWYVQVLEPA